MKYKVDFFDACCLYVDDAIFEAENEEDLCEQCREYVSNVLAPMGLEIAGSKHYEIKG